MTDGRTPRDVGVANPLGGAELAAFVATVEGATLSVAGEALGLSQSAVTKRVQALERRVAVRLFERGPFGMRPTAAGRRLYPEAKHALEALRRAETAVAEGRDDARRMTSIAASHTIGEFLLPGWLAGFRRQEPDARAQVAVVNSPGVLAAVREREVDIGFVEGVDDLQGFASFVAFVDEMAVVVASDHPWARSGEVAVAALGEEAYFTRELGSGTRSVATAALSQAGVELVPTLEAASTQAVKRAVAGGGFSILSKLAIEAELVAGTLTAIRVDALDLHRRLHAVCNADHALHGMPRSFWAWLQAHSAG